MTGNNPQARANSCGGTQFEDRKRDPESATPSRPGWRWSFDQSTWPWSSEQCKKAASERSNSSLSPRALVSRDRRKLLSRPPGTLKLAARTAYFVLTIGHRLSQFGRMGSAGLPVFRVGPLVRLTRVPRNSAGRFWIPTIRPCERADSRQQSSGSVRRTLSFPNESIEKKRCRPDTAIPARAIWAQKAEEGTYWADGFVT